ncbi:hypothetical protein CVT25_009941 [Psilocybe cyanescens]|uniref:Uncharacterized protein n=1 Tax=Psilocybe cyanescens TaxID=93625 RepID=A0A409XCU7_PSICY|nr:hypothetical protein CVT25_009941 [Psilocybe cyanescens]
MSFTTQSPDPGAVNQNDAHFAFARIKGDIHLVQASCSSSKSPIAPVDVKVFQHEFIHIFRFSEHRTVHPTDICFLETIDDQHAFYQEEDEKVYLAKEIMQRMQKYNCDPRLNRKQYYQPPRTVLLTRQRQRQW